MPYDVMTSCNKCGGENKVDIKDSIEGTVSEAETVCKTCGHADMWGFGFFESRQEGLKSCKKYNVGEKS